MKKMTFAAIISCLILGTFSGCDDPESSDGSLCTEGEIVCEDGILKSCIDGKIEESTCPDGCAEDGKSCQKREDEACTADTCDDSRRGIVNRCVDGRIEPEQCPADRPVCENGVCVPESPCTAGEIQCSEDGTGTETCGDEGIWGAPEPCGEGMICDADAGICVEKPADTECAPGSMKCADITIQPNTYRMCGDDGRWRAKAVPCAAETPVCTGDDGSAHCAESQNECISGSMKCADTVSVPNTYVTCTDGRWSDKAVSCGTAAPICTGAAGAASCIECTAGQVRCTESGEFQICDGGTFTTRSQCGSKAACSADLSAPGCRCAVSPAAETKCAADNHLLTCTARSFAGVNYTEWTKSEHMDSTCRKFVVGYMPGSDHKFKSFFPLIKWEYLTHVNISFAHVNPDGSLETSEVTKHLAETLETAHAHGVKVLVSVAKNNRGDFKTAILNPAARANLVKNIIHFTQDNGLDGFDIDYEEYAWWDETKDALPQFARELKAAKPYGMLMTCAVTNWARYGLDWPDSFDIINMMSYDHVGPDEPAPAPHASFEHFTKDLARWQSHHDNAYSKKITGGVPFYGYTWSVTPSSGDKCEAWRYYTILQKFGVQAADKDFTDDTWYNGRPTIEKKCRFIKDNGYAGMMIWQIYQDAYDNPDYLLIDVIGKNMK